MRRSLVIAVFLVLAVPIVARKPERDAIFAVVDRFFEAMTEKDVEKAKAVLLPEGRFHSVRYERDGWVVRTYTNAESLDGWRSEESVFVERMWEEDVRSQMGMAME